MGLDASAGTGTTVSDRKMSATDGGTLNYALYPAPSSAGRPSVPKQQYGLHTLRPLLQRRLPDPARRDHTA